MGTRMAPSYAYLFMNRFERSFLAQEHLVWKLDVPEQERLVYIIVGFTYHNNILSPCGLHT